jgi:hypothetical protein
MTTRAGVDADSQAKNGLLLIARLRSIRSVFTPADFDAAWIRALRNLH